jgi:hypothetical protein
LAGNPRQPWENWGVVFRKGAGADKAWITVLSEVTAYRSATGAEAGLKAAAKVETNCR